MVARVLVVDDESGIRQVLKECLRSRYEVSTAEDGRAAQELLSRNDYDAIVLDIHLPHLSGMEIYQWLEAEKPEQARRTLFITCVSSYPTYEKFAEENRDRCFAKPFMIDELMLAVERLIQKNAAARPPSR
ncbi:response regulator [bacterium]|nr:response regulator [bacterium]